MALLSVTTFARRDGRRLSEFGKKNPGKNLAMPLTTPARLTYQFVYQWRCFPMPKSPPEAHSSEALEISAAIYSGEDLNVLVNFFSTSRQGHRANGCVFFSVACTKSALGCHIESIGDYRTLPLAT